MPRRNDNTNERRTPRKQQPETVRARTAPKPINWSKLVGALAVYDNCKCHSIEMVENEGVWSRRHSTACAAYWL